MNTSPKAIAENNSTVVVMTNGSSPRAINLSKIPQRIGIHDTRKKQVHYFTTKGDRTPFRPGSLSKTIMYKYNSQNTPIEFSLNKTTGEIHVDNLYSEHERNKNQQIPGKAFLTGLQQLHPTQITLSNASLIPVHGIPRDRWMPRAYSTINNNYYGSLGFKPSYNNYANENWTFKRNREIVKALMGNKTLSHEDVRRLLPNISQKGKIILQTHTGKKKNWALAMAVLDLVSRNGKFNNVEEEHMKYNNLINLNPMIYRRWTNPNSRPRTSNSSPQQKRHKSNSQKR